MGYTDLEQKSPAAIFFVGLAVVILAGLLGLQGNSNVTLGLELMFTSERRRSKDSSVNIRSFHFVLGANNHSTGLRPPRVRHARFLFIAFKDVGVCVILWLSAFWQ